MKYNLTTSPTGDLSLTRHESTLPPLGLLIPAGQTVVVGVSTPTALGSLFTATDPLPGSFEIRTSAETYGVDNGVAPGAWVDYTLFARAESVMISGEIRITNPASYDIGITW